MKDEDLIRMANQIADFFEPYPEDEAIDSVVDHLRKFWDPRMRKDLLAISPEAKGKLKPLARSAIERL